MDLIIRDDSRVGTVRFTMSEENVRKKLALPWITFCSDGGSVAPEPPFTNAMPHPRSYGSFARVLGKYVREEGLVPLETGDPSTDPPADLAARDRRAGSAGRGLLRRRRRVRPPRRSPIMRPSKSRTSSRPACSTSSSTASLCFAKASIRALRRGARSGDRVGSVPADDAGRSRKELMTEPVTDALSGFERTLPGFEYREGVLHVEGISVEEIADLANTPTFVYSARAIRKAYHRMERAFAPLQARLHYAVKACGNLSHLSVTRGTRCGDGCGLGGRDGARLAGRRGDGEDRLRGGREDRIRDSGGARRPSQPDRRCLSELRPRQHRIAGPGRHPETSSPSARSSGSRRSQASSESSRGSASGSTRTSIRARTSTPRPARSRTSSGIDAERVVEIVDRFAAREELVFTRAPRNTSVRRCGSSNRTS